MNTILFSTASYGLSISSPCRDAGYTAGQSCPNDVDKPWKCSLETCTMVNCTATNECLCLPSASDCPSGSGGGTDNCAGISCPSDTEWKDTSFLVGPYQSRTTYIMNLITCECIARTQYRCKSGYWQDGASGLYTEPNCVQCASYPDTLASGDGGLVIQDFVVNSTPGSATSPADCYVKGNLTLQDDSGQYFFTTDCYYNEQ